MKKKDKKLLQDRIDCIDHWINTPWMYTDNIKKSSFTLGKLLTQYSKCAEEIKKHLEIKYKSEQIIEKAKKLRETIKNADEFWDSEMYLMSTPNYKWENIPEFVHKDMITDEMFFGYISEKYGEFNALKVRIFLDNESEK